ncbi:hypothetical protein [Roseateles saccharophilus]|nr:hypothetical protein [Roseateles saccharophilus]
MPRPWASRTLAVKRSPSWQATQAVPFQCRSPRRAQLPPTAQAWFVPAAL